MGAVQSIGRGGMQHPVIHVEVHAQSLQAHQVHVDLAGADLTAAGHGHPRLAESPDKRAEHGNGRAHLRDELVGSLARIDGCGIDGKRVPLARDRGPKTIEHLAHDLDIGDDRHVANRGDALAAMSLRAEFLAPATVTSPERAWLP